MTKPMMPLDAVVHRLDRLAGHYLSAILRLHPEGVDGMVEDMLGEIGDVLGTDQIVFESSSERSTRYGPARVWTRTSSTQAREAALTIPVAVAAHRVGLLSVGSRADGQEWPQAVEDRLRVLADSMVLAIQRGEQMRASRHRDSEDGPPHAETATRTYDENEDGVEFEDIIGDSPLLRTAMRRVLEVAPTDASVVLVGETGTGKELFAWAVHSRSRRRGRAFVRVNCAALPPTLIESELFGHERGAFTGAVGTRQGRFELAHHGTLFLDEIGDLPADVQAKLLRVLQEGEFERVGSSQSRRVDVRVVAATHHDLDAAVKEGRFRPDLYYRLNVFPIALPPLRARIEDIERLVWFFVNRRQRALNRRITTIPPAVLAALQQHSWPGNVRELQNVVERAMIHSTGDTLLLDEGPGLRLDASGDRGTLEDVERRHIEMTLYGCRWRINGPGNAADTLGLHPNTLRFRMKKLGIERPKALGIVGDFRRRSA
jgi:formate hydrogenlyase transcriptional activator